MGLKGTVYFAASEACKLASPTVLCLSANFNFHVVVNFP